MSEYRRAYVPGGHYFFTLVTHHRQPLFANPDHIDRLRTAFRHVKFAHPFVIEAIVILPNHLHALWKLPDGDDDFSTRWRLIKHKFSVGLDVSKNHRGEKAIWQRRFWEHLIRDQTDWTNHMDYIHYNPVKHGYVQRPADWPYSSFEGCVKKGWYEATSTAPNHIEGMNPE
ncbi:MAG: transposase [Alphaproteobacteria bacterium]|jgi:putative transposase|nr:transposase [Alphaproteobacteria bacterium]